MGTKLELAGQRFGKLLVREVAGKTNKGIYRWLCVCDCGNLTIVRVTSLTSGNTNSCGCGISEYARTPKKYKGLPVSIYSDEYDAWQNMKNRCYNKNNSAYHNYGGRGIFVCNKWKNDFAAFFSDMGYRPSKKHSVDRINVNGIYEPLNCRWATVEEQSRNKRSNRYIEYDGRKMILKDWASEFNVHYMVLFHHLKRKGMDEIVSFYKEKGTKERSRFRGVGYDPENGLWRVYFKQKGHDIYGGRFKNKFKAALRYNEMVELYSDGIGELNILTDEEVLMANKVIPRGVDKRSKTGYRGITPYGNKFCAKISHEKKIIHVGYFDTAKEAAGEYNNMVIKLNLPTHKLNIINE